MTREEAQKQILSEWLPIVEKHFQCTARLDESLTDVYEWGWVFHIIAGSPKTVKEKAYHTRQYAIDRVTGYSIPVGTKGIMDAIYYIKRHRKDYEDSK